MRIVLTLLLTLSLPTFAANYECIHGTRDVYRGNMEMPAYSENFMVCQSLDKPKKAKHHQSH